ncbi:hypothetical protein D3C71_1860930 [compost metagenome]
MALHVAQQDLLDLAVDVEVQDRRVEPLVLAGQPDLLVVELDRLRRILAAVDDGRDAGGTTQAAARTLPLDVAASGLDDVFGHWFFTHFAALGPPRGGLGDSPATRRVFEAGIRDSGFGIRKSGYAALASTNP